MHKKKNRSFAVFGVVGVFCLTLVLSLISSVILSPKKAEAATSYTAYANEYGIADVKGDNVSLQNGDVTLAWIDAATIEVTFPKANPVIKVIALPRNTADNGTGRLQDQRYDGSNGDYGLPGWPCHFIIDTPGGVNKTLDKANVDIDFKATSSSSCDDAGTLSGVAMAHPELSVAYFKWADAGTIVAAGDEFPGAFTVAGTDTPNIYLRVEESSASKCQDRLVLSADKKTVRYYELDPDFDGKPPDDAHANGCSYRDVTSNNNASPPQNKEILLADPIDATGKLASSKVAGTGVYANAGSAADDNSCESTGFVFGWMTCGIIDSLKSVTQHVFTDILQPYLRVSPLDTTASGSANDNPIYHVWSSMRNIANILLIFALMTIVFGQAIGGGLIDAYTAKKALPRILVAAILINISLFIVAGLVDIFNILGQGIGALIVTPFKGTIFTKFKPNGGSNGVDVVLLIGIAVVALLGSLSFLKLRDPSRSGLSDHAALGATIWPFVHILLIFVLLPAALVTLAIFATLIIRQGLILILVVTAPVAFALFALPATEKYFKTWMKTLIDTLLVYPIITVLFSISVVMAAISYNAGDTSTVPLSGFIGTIVSFIILIIPLMLIPFAFKLAGGIVGNLANTVKGRAGGLGAIGKKHYQEDRARIKQAEAYREDRPSRYSERRTKAKSKGEVRIATGLRKTSAEKRHEQFEANVRDAQEQAQGYRTFTDDKGVERQVPINERDKTLRYNSKILREAKARSAASAAPVTDVGTHDETHPGGGTIIVPTTGGPAAGGGSPPPIGGGTPAPPPPPVGGSPFIPSSTGSAVPPPPVGGSPFIPTTGPRASSGTALPPPTAGSAARTHAQFKAANPGIAPDRSTDAWADQFINRVKGPAAAPGSTPSGGPVMPQTFNWNGRLQIIERSQDTSGATPTVKWNIRDAATNAPVDSVPEEHLDKYFRDRITQDPDSYSL